MIFSQQYLVYHIYIIASAILALISQKINKNKKINLLFYSLSLLSLLYLVGFRKCGVGVDDYTYRDLFVKTTTQGPLSVFKTTTLEPGYLLLSTIVGWFTNDYQVLLAISSFIPLLFFYLAFAYQYKKTNINLFLTIYIFGYMLLIYFIGINRLFIAVGIFAYSLKYFEEGDKKKYIKWIIIASMFHYSALFCLILLYLMKKDRTTKQLSKFYSALIVLTPILFLLISILFRTYFASKYSGYSIKSGFHISVGDFDKVPIIIGFLFMYPYMKKIDPDSKTKIMIWSISIIFSIYNSLVDLGRLQWYFNFEICLLFPILVKGISSTKSKALNLIVIAVIIPYCLLYSSKIFMTNKGYANYKNIIYERIINEG